MTEKCIMKDNIIKKLFEEKNNNENKYDWEKL